MVSSNVRFEVKASALRAPEEVMGQTIPEVLEAYLEEVKAQAGGRTVDSAPRGRIPVLTGRLRDSLQWRNLRGKNPVLVAVHYARYLPGGGVEPILRLAMANFAKTREYAAALRRGAKRAGRAP